MTYNLGLNWQQFATLPAEQRDQPKLAWPGPLLTAVVYQPIRTGWVSESRSEIIKLARIVKYPSLSEAVVFYPEMNGLRGMGHNQTMFARYQVFGVDPGNASHLIAPDIWGEQMMQSTDGGSHWNPMTQLTNLVTDNGRLRFHMGRTPLSPRSASAHRTRAW